MNNPTERIKQLKKKLESIREKAIENEKRYKHFLDKTDPEYTLSARNLVQYLSVRQHDIRDIQRELGYLGLSRLGRAESHIIDSLTKNISALNAFIKSQKLNTGKPELSVKKSTKLINKHSKVLLGSKSKGRDTRIMVTLPTEAATDYSLVYQLIKNGMNVARINCAHDDSEVWMMIIEQLEKAGKSLGKKCKIMMDLGGPKLRTGSMMPGPKVLHIRPMRDDFGNVSRPAKLWIAPPKSIPPREADALIPVSGSWLKNVKKGDQIHFTDTRGKKCLIDISRKEGKGRWAECKDSAYVSTGTRFYLNTTSKREEIIDYVGELLPLEQRIILKKGDILILHSNSGEGEQAVYDENGNVSSPAHISCTLPQVFVDVKKGEPILFDDGKIEGIIRKASAEKLEIEISFAKENGSKLRADKGINLPESKLSLKGLTTKDKEDIRFIAAHADAVNFSFVNEASDVEELISELKALNPELGIVLKIETRKAIRNLAEILLTAMQNYPVGVMIARGDLAIECGWKYMAKIQYELLKMCEAAHLPVIWATQVLENLAKKGTPSRAEITDAAMAQQADCVMLNKGPHIIQALEMLDKILRYTEGYQDKQAPMLPSFNDSFVC